VNQFLLDLPDSLPTIIPMAEVPALRRAGNPTLPVIAGHVVESRILTLRGLRVMLSSDLAELYGVQPRASVPAVKRNRNRFPEDFMFQLTREEDQILKSQSVISSWGGARRAPPYGFTEQGVAGIDRGRNPYRRGKAEIKKQIAWGAFHDCPLDRRPGWSRSVTTYAGLCRISTGKSADSSVEYCP
jgi:hypothetical protein